MKKTAMLGALALVLSTGVYAKDWKEVRLGVEAEYKPFTYKAPDGKLIGFEIELGDAICAEMKVKCTWVEQAFDGLIPALNAKKFDAIISSMSITDDRKKSVLFSDKYYKTPSRIVSKTEAKIDGTAATTKGKKVGVLKGSTQEAYAKGALEKVGATVSSYDNQQQVYLDLKSGRLDATVADSVEVSEGFLKSPDGKGFGFAGPVLLDPVYFGAGVGAGIRKDDADLVTKFNAAIKAVRANGTYKKINDKYFNFDVFGG